MNCRIGRSYPYHRRAPWRRLLVLGLVAAPAIYAIDPTELQPAGPLTPGTFEVQEKLKYDAYDDYEAEAETSVEYEVTRKLAVRLFGAVERGEKYDIEGDLKLRLKYVLNPDAERAPIAAVTLEGAFPVGHDNDGIDVDLRLRLTNRLSGENDRHAFHLTLSGKYVGDEDVAHDGIRDIFRKDREDARKFLFMAVPGYTFDLTPQTTLVADVAYKQLAEKGADATLLELGVKHNLGKSTTLALGAGLGLGDDAPDWTARAGIQFRFGGKR
ncbi:MAG: hypothetical protein HY706_00995 [Candidatus Hydrogenedentes bacterium]|nr:hypothetical protein [Candidatus Hydrogenedentota bacterium]